MNFPGNWLLTKSFIGASPYYGDGRLHAWYQIDNIFCENIQVSATPEPSSYALMVLGYFGLVCYKRKLKIKPNSALNIEVTLNGQEKLVSVNWFADEVVHSTVQTFFDV